MKLGYAIHEIRFSPEVVVAPNTTAQFSEKDYAELIALGSIAEPTPDQVALWEMTNKAESAAAPAKKEKESKDKNAKVVVQEAKPDDQSQDDSDKEVTEI